MKHQTLTILLLLFLGSNCIGQEDEKSKEDRHFGIAQSHTFLYSLTNAPKQDTVRVLMLVCDTTVADVGMYSSQGGRSKFYQTNVWWQFGYEVYESYFVPAHEERQGDGIIFYQDEWRKRFVTRLDQNKKPLPKSIVVWITKEIK